MKYLLFILAIALLAAVSLSAKAEYYLEWQTPTERVDGSPLSLEEIGGFQIRYLGEYEGYILVKDRLATAYALSEFEDGRYTFSVAVFDTDGLYSNYVPVEPIVLTRVPPGPVFEPRVVRSRQDITALCLATADCRLGVLSNIRQRE